MRRPLHLKNRPMFVFLLVTYIAVAAIPLLVLGLTTTVMLQRFINKQVTSANINRVQQVQTVVDRRLNSIEEKGLQTLLSSAVVDVRHINYDNLDQVENVLKVKKLESELNNLRLFNDSIASIYFYNIDHDFIVTSGGSSASFRRFTDTEWYDRLLEQDNNERWSDVRKNLDTNLVNASWLGRDVVSLYLMTSTYLHTFRGIMVINIYAESLSEQLSQMIDSTQGDVFMYNSCGNAVAVNSISLSEQQIDSDNWHFIQQTPHGYFTGATDDRSYVYYFVNAPSGFTYVLRNPLNSLTAIVNNIRQITFLLSGGLVLISIFISYRLSSHFYLPIRRMMEMLRQKPHVKLSVQTGNEFEQIDSSLRALYDESQSMRNYIDNSVQAIKENCARKLLTGSAEDYDAIRERLKYVNCHFSKPYFIALIILINTT